MSSTDRATYRSVRWGNIRQIHISNAIFADGCLTLDAAALSVYAALLNTYSSTPKRIRVISPDASVRVAQSKLAERTGYSRRELSRGINELVEKGHVDRVPNLDRERSRKGKLLTQEYVLLLHPNWGNALKSGTEPNVLFNNRLSYFTIPRCFVTECQHRWSMAQVTGSQLKLYIAILWMADQHRANVFELNVPELRKASTLSPVTFGKTLEDLEVLGLIYTIRNTVEICDPYTGSPLSLRYDDEEGNPQDYYVQDAKGRDKRLDINLDYTNPAAVESFIRNGLGYSGAVINQGNGDVTISCPFHADSHPSLSISPSKRGCWHCFGGSCGRSGSLFDLVKGFEVATYRNPDAKAEAIYNYVDETDRLLYQVLRYRDANGQKYFLQRLPASGGWIWKVRDVNRVLYNLYQLRLATIAILCEGEKDADTASGFNMIDHSHRIIVGTTSGGSSSWKPEFAKYFKADEASTAKRVIVIPDADEAGWHWSKTVTESLTAEGIEHRIVSFADAGCKDLTEFMAGHNVPELIRRCGVDWVMLPGSTQTDPLGLNKPDDPHDLITL